MQNLIRSRQDHPLGMLEVVRGCLWKAPKPHQGPTRVRNTYDKQGWMLGAIEGATADPAATHSHDIIC